MDRKLASIALTVACLLAGCGSTTPTAPPPSPAGSPAAQTPPPSATPSPSAAPSRSPAASRSLMSTTGWVPFTSDRYGYTLSYPPTHTGIPPCTESAPTVVSQAQRDFTFGTDQFETLGDNGNTPLDEIVFGADPCVIGFFGFAETIPAGTSVDDIIRQSVGARSTTVNRSPSRSTVSRGDSMSAETASRSGS